MVNLTMVQGCNLYKIIKKKIEKIHIIIIYLLALISIRVLILAMAIARALP